MVKQLDAGNEAMLFIDAGIEWEKNYQYWNYVRHDLGEPGHRRKRRGPGRRFAKVPVMTRGRVSAGGACHLQAVFSSNQKQAFY